MIVDNIAREVFSFLCHQDPARSFAPGGSALAMCARCTGVYIGFLLALPLIFQARSLGRNLALWLHGALVLQVAVFGFGLIPHGPFVRLISGQLFAAGVLYFLSRSVLAHNFNPGKTQARRLLQYLLSLVALLLALQSLARLPWPGAANLLNTLSLLGLALFFLWAVIFLLTWVRAITVRTSTASNRDQLIWR